MKKSSFLIVLILSKLVFSASADTSFLQNTVNYLSSTKLEGRRAGAPGNELAVDFVEKTFKDAGLATLDESYQEGFTIFTEMIKNGDNQVLITSGEMEKSFEPISYSLSGDVKASEVAFVGYGISIPKNDPKIKYDDYEGLDVTDKIVIVLTGDPGVKNPKSPFRDTDYMSYRSIHYKLKNAINNGAKGILIVNDPLSMENYPQESAPVFNPTEGGGDRFNIIAGYVTNLWVNNFVLKNKDTKTLQETITKTEKPNSFFTSAKMDLSVHLKKKTGRVSNVVAVVPGADPTLKNEVVVVGAHLDHLGFGGESSMEQSSLIENSNKSKLQKLVMKYKVALATVEKAQGKIHPGADDNASGTATVLKLALDLKDKKLKRTFVFVLFNAEEEGLLGSASFVENWQSHIEKYGNIVAMLNYDMVGRYSNEVSLMGVNSGLEWKNILNPLMTDLKFELKNEAVGSSDHASFLAKKIPALFFTTGAHPDYHTSRDTADKINFTAMESIENYSLSLIDQLENSTITFNKDYTDGQEENRPRGYGAHLGCVPEFGQPDTVKGVICTRASVDSPAEKAGIQPNDVLIQIGDIEVTSVYDLAFALKYYRAGDEIELTWLRNGVAMKAKIILARSRRP